MGTTIGGTSVLNACGGFPSKERTFTWTPSTSGTATISTCGSSFDTIVSIRTGDCTGAAFTCDDDGCAPGSTMSPTVVAGTSYTIVVDGFASGNAGEFTLTVTPP